MRIITISPIYFVQTNWPSFTLGLAWSAITVIGLVEAMLTARREDTRRET